MMQDFQNALYINDVDPTNAVIFDREWLRREASIRRAHDPLGGAAQLPRLPVVPPDVAQPSGSRGGSRSPTTRHPSVARRRPSSGRERLGLA